MRKSMVMALLVCAAFATQLLAVGEARLTGKVVDPSGKPLEGVTITATATEEINWEQSTKTKKDGTFAFFIIRGTIPYKFTFEKDGFGTYEEVIKLQLVPAKNDRTFTLGTNQVATTTEAAPAQADPATLAYNEGVALWNKGEEAAAIAKIEEAVGLNDSLTAGHIALAKMYGKTKNWDKAIVAGNKALEVDSDQPEIAAVLAEAYEKKGDKAKAAEFRKKAPANPAALFNEAARMINAGNDAGAEGYLKQALAADEKFAQAHYELGMVYARLGKNAEAKTHLQAYLDLEPKGKDAPTAKEMLTYVQ
jgi:tetratricopeptide (TPR) repeat protein